MTLFRITLHLARSKEFPNGSSRHGYEFVAPLTADAHLDARAWKSQRDACTVRRFWADEEFDLGHLVHRAGGDQGAFWAFRYDIAGDEDDEAGYRFGAHTFNIGDYVSIRDEDAKLHTFVLAKIDPV